jgi:serine/threonine-protein kinase PpkA
MSLKLTDLVTKTDASGHEAVCRDALPDRFEQPRLLAKGGFAYVFHAQDRGRGEEVAVKVLTPDAAAQERALARFLREARAQLDLDHPHVLKVHEVFEGSPPCYSMEYLPVRSLRKAMSGRVLSMAQALEVLRQVCAGVAHAHSKGIVHRDLKPANILIHPQRGAVVIDFGIAFFEDLPRLTDAATLVGTPRYMSPEVVMGGKPDRRADVYSLGILLFELVTGDVPFRDLSAHVTSPVPSLPDSFGGAAQKLIQTALAKHPGSRFQTIEEFVAAFEDCA